MISESKREREREPLWDANPNAFYAYAISYSVWYVGEGVPHLLGEAPRVAAKMELQPNNRLHEFQYQP